MQTIIWIMIVLVIVIGLLSPSLPKVYRSRKCQGGGWRKTFPTASKEQIREFLSIVTESFAFRDRDRLRFGPTDGVMEIYQAIYKSSPTKPPFADQMELETFFIELERKYKKEFPTSLISQETTLGDVFHNMTGIPTSEFTQSTTRRSALGSG